MDEFWRPFWTVLAVALVVGEVATAGFFMLPFAIGAGVAAGLAWAGLGVVVQWAAFVATGTIAFMWLRRYAQTDDVHPIGANRFDGATAVVIKEINHLSGTGSVRMGAEEWRAVSDTDDIAEGTHVDIIEVRGTRLVVATVKETKSEGV